MRSCLLIGAIVVSAALVPSGCRNPEAPADEAASAASLERDRDEVIDAHLALVDAYDRGDADAFVRVLDPSAELLVFHPRLQARFDGVDEVRRELPRMFARLGEAEWSDLHALVNVHGDVAWLTSEVLVESPNLPQPFAGRATEIYVRKPDGWKLVHGHWSAAPES